MDILGSIFKVVFSKMFKPMATFLKWTRWSVYKFCVLKKFKNKTNKYFLIIFPILKFTSLFVWMPWLAVLQPSGGFNFLFHHEVTLDGWRSFYLMQMAFHKKLSNKHKSRGRQLTSPLRPIRRSWSIGCVLRRTLETPPR